MCKMTRERDYRFIILSTSIVENVPRRNNPLMVKWRRSYNIIKNMSQIGTFSVNLQSPVENLITILLKN